MPKVIVLTALTVEYLACRRHLAKVREATFEGTVYETGQFAFVDGFWEVTLAQTGPGNQRAAIETERAIRRFDPDVALFVGIAGGLKDVRIGHVVAATKVYGYESGKARAEFEPRPDVGRSSYPLVQRAMAEGRKSGWLDRVGSGLRSRLSTPPRAFVAPIAAGEKVLAATAAPITQFLRREYGDAVAVEMEGRGFLEAAYANAPIWAMVVRGISDILDDKSKSDASGSQELAADTAAAFTFEVLANLAFEDTSVPLTPDVDTGSLADTGLAVAKTTDELRVWGPDGDTPPSLAAVRASVPAGATVPEEYIVDRADAATTASRLARAVAGYLKPRLVLVGAPMTGKSCFTYLVAREWLERDSPVAFVVGSRLSANERRLLRQETNLLVVLEQDASGTPRELLSVLHSNARAILVTRRPEYEAVADEIFATVYQRDYFIEDSGVDAVTTTLLTHDDQFVRVVIGKLAERYSVALTSGAMDLLSGLVWALGPDPSTRTAVIGVAKAVLLTARASRERANPAGATGVLELIAFVTSISEDAKQGRASASGILASLFDRFPDPLRRLLMAFKLLHDLTGGLSVSRRQPYV